MCLQPTSRVGWTNHNKRGRGTHLPPDHLDGHTVGTTQHDLQHIIQCTRMWQVRLGRYNAHGVLWDYVYEL